MKRKEESDKASKGAVKRPVDPKGAFRKTQKQVVVTKKASKKKAIKMTGKFGGKSNALGQGGRAAQLRAQGVPGGVIGNLARAAQAAPGQANYHKAANKKKAASKKAYMNRVMPGGKNC